MVDAMLIHQLRQHEVTLFVVRAAHHGNAIAFFNTKFYGSVKGLIARFLGWLNRTCIVQLLRTLALLLCTPNQFCPKKVIRPISVTPCIFQVL